MLKFLYLLVTIFCTTFVILSFAAEYPHAARLIQSSSAVMTSTTGQDVIYRHVSNVLMKRSSSSKKGIPNTPELYTAIVAQIKARIHTEITSKISASIFQKVKTNLSIKASVMGGTVQVNNAEIEAIQSAAVDGLQSKISRTIEKRFDQVLSKSVQPKSLLLPTSQKVFSNTQLTKALMNAETIVRSEIKTILPEIQKTLKSSVTTQLNAHIKDLEVNIPGILKIEISAKINVVSSVKTVVTSIYKSYADVSVAIAVKSYISGIKKTLQK